MKLTRRYADDARRKSRLPVRDLRGNFLITDSALDAAARLLPSYRGADGDHEGLVFLLGRETETLTIFTTALAPDADHGWGHVICDEAAVGSAARSARAHGLGILGQVHTHGRDATEHSIGDDTLIVMPFEGMLSIIAPWYGRVGLRPLKALGVHQFQDERWVLIHPASVRDRFRVIPDGIDLR
ncbi:MAG TPA: hypothetical protein VK501_17050 [Baekduia sp.]|uniref:hypothetical protein n=1 Tax=Baekduia sp. TaxID=2600305 RepID=UPI002D0A3C43|nr:hypothetical protein [Baekduia sp.]HMJ35620.1 hypothetical protein [Baekduia sp.]